MPQLVNVCVCVSQAVTDGEVTQEDVSDTQVRVQQVDAFPLLIVKL